MAHYIDADRLKAEIERRMTELKVGNYYLDNWEQAVGYENALIDFELLIDSLQQEQPEGLHFTPLNRLIQKIPSGNWNDTVNNYAKKLRDCLIKEGYRKDAKVLQGYISYMNGNNVPMATMDEQEQPEVDIEREIENEWKECHPTDEGMGLESANIVKEQFDAIAYHFYELGASVMRKRITNPEFNQKVIEKMKYECPVDEFNERKED